MKDKKNIRNFCIIAHIDHGKSTLADRILERTKAVSERESKDQLLDDMELEQERGITIKARAVRLIYRAEDGLDYEFNLIDTPGHVDFNYEVSRSLAACEGAILVVDASQGVEAQTLANAYLAIDHNLELVPVINKIDLPSANPDHVAQEIENTIGIDARSAPRVSAKTGINIKGVLEAVVKSIPPPKGDDNGKLQALIFDAVYDSYKGVIVYIRLKEGTVKPGDRIRMMSKKAEFEVVQTGVIGPYGLIPNDGLCAGEVGYLTASIKNISEAEVGDTITSAKNPAKEPLPGYRKVNPMVFSGIYPVDGSKYNELKDALLKLKLNDASLSFEPETSAALGFGFRCGFLGLLHMEIIGQRIEREYNLDIITTAPSVKYIVVTKDNESHMLDNPSSFPKPENIEESKEPIVRAEILTPTDYIGSVMELCTNRRGEYQDMEYIDKSRVKIKFRLPLNEIIYDFFDVLKSRTKGYASLDYEIDDYQRSKLVKLDMVINKEPIDALSFIVHADTAHERGRNMVKKLKENIPRQLFEIPIQATIGGKVIARETVKALKKDVLAKCYGGDITRKKKLLEKQKEGKKKMKKLGSVEIPQEAFMAVLRSEE